MKAHVISNRHKIQARPHIFEVKDGIYYVWIDFDVRIELCSTGTGSIDGQLSMYFDSKESKTDMSYGVEVALPFGELDGQLFGQTDRYSYHGTYYTSEAYDKISTEENEFITNI